MTYQEDPAVVAAREKFNEAVAEHDQFNRYDPEGCRGGPSECITIKPALTAYGDAVALAVRRETHQHEWVRPTSVNAMLETACGRCGEPYRIEATHA